MDPRKILGVGEHATEDDIRRAYRQQARKHHPDHGGDAWAFQQVKDAFEELTKDAGPGGRTRQSGQSTPRPAESSRRSPASGQQQAGQRQRKRRRQPQQGDRPVGDQRPAGQPGKKKSTRAQQPLNWRQLLTGQLPLQTSTSWFILVNCLDVFFTFRLLTLGAIESNPIANFILQRWGFRGMIAFKLLIVALVCVTAQIVAQRSVRSARTLLIAGTVMVGLVVAYSLWLQLLPAEFWRQFSAGP